MATAAWVDLLMDPRLLAVSSRGKPTRDRDRRALFIGALAVGSFVGAFSRARVGSALALLLSALVKAAVTAMFWFNRAEVAEEDRDPEEEAPARLDV